MKRSGTLSSVLDHCILFFVLFLFFKDKGAEISKFLSVLYLSFLFLHFRLVEKSDTDLEVGTFDYMFPFINETAYALLVIIILTFSFGHEPLITLCFFLVNIITKLFHNKKKAVAAT